MIAFTDLYCFQCAPQATQKANSNCEYTVATYLDYGRGQDGLRQEFCVTTNTRCVQGTVAGQTFQAWFLEKVKSVPTQYLTTALPEGL